MRSIFLSREQVFDRPLPLFQTVGAMAAATDLVLLTTVDDGFTVDSGSVNWYLSGGDCADLEEVPSRKLCHISLLLPMPLRAFLRELPGNSG